MRLVNISKPNLIKSTILKKKETSTKIDKYSYMDEIQTQNLLLIEN